MYTIKEASARSGVGVPLLRAWERRYGVVAPTRTPSGYRLYDDDAIDRLRAMRQLIAHGWSAQQAAERVRDVDPRGIADLAESLETSEDAAPEADPASVRISAAEDVIARIVGAARRIDAGAMEAALDDAFSSARFEAVADRIVMPALREIGGAWERGEITVAGEHAASQAVLRRMAMAYEGAGVAGVAERPVLVGLGPGTRHEIGAFAFAVAARRAGLPVLYLGPDLPAESWRAAVVGRRARAAVIGVPTRADVRRATTVIRALRSPSGAHLIAVGGDAAARAAASTGVLALPEELPEAVAVLRQAIEDER